MRRLIPVLLLLVGVQAEGAFQFRDGWTKWTAWTSPEHAAALAADVHGIVLWNYSSGQASLIYVPSADALKTRADVLVVPLDDRIYSPGGPFDARTGIPSTVPPGGRQDPYTRGVVGAYLIQFIGPIASEWSDAVTNLGVTFGSAAYVPYNAEVVAGTPEQMATVATLPFVQYVDYWHPFEKGEVDYGSSLDPRERLYVRYELIPSSDTTIARNELAAISGWVGDIGLVVQNGNYPRLLQNRLLLYASPQGLSGPPIDSIWPRRAPTGDTVVLTGDFLKGTMVAFNGVPSPHIEMLSASRMSAVIPAQIPVGAVDVVVEEPDHQSQIFLGFEVGRRIPDHDLVQRDDLITADWMNFCCFEGQYTQSRWLMPDGTVRAIRRPFFDGSGDTNSDQAIFIDDRQRINVVARSRTIVLDTRYTEVGQGPSFLAGAHFVIEDREGNYILSRDQKIERYSSTGQLLRSIEPYQVWQFDLADDQCTIAIPGGKTISQVNMCTGEQLPAIDFDASNIRYLPDRTILAANRNVVRRYSPDAALLAEIPLDYGWYYEEVAIGITADARSAWISAGRFYYKYDLVANRIVGEFEPKRRANSERAIHVYGGWTAARGFAPPDVSIDHVNLLGNGRLEIIGAGLIDGVTLTIGGTAIIIDERTENRIRGHVVGILPAGGVVVVTAPNGTTTSFALTTPIPTLNEWGALVAMTLLCSVAITRLRR